MKLEDIEAAAARIEGQVQRTPCTRSDTLSALLGCELYIKFENQQFTASFKERGALNSLLCLDDRARGRGVIAMSAGNHAQALAYHGARLGLPTTIVMPRTTPNAKVLPTTPSSRNTRSSAKTQVPDAKAVLPSTSKSPWLMWFVWS